MTRIASLLLLLFVGCAHPSAGAPEPEPTQEVAATPAPETPAPLVSLGGAVASAHPLATAAGEAMLTAGGSAFDAAVATALVLGVVNPQSSGLGAGGFAVFKDGDGAVRSLDFRERAPSFFDADVYLTEGRDPQRGPWASGVPGEAAGLAELHRIGGVLPWETVVEPARAAAADGFEVGPDLARGLARRADRILADPGLAGDFAPGGGVLKEGDLCRRPALAATLGYLQVHGGDALYRGPLAVSLAGFFAAQGVPWTPDELAAYQATERAPLTGSYRGRTVHTMGPPSSGGIAILQILAMLELAEHHAQAVGSVDWSRTLIDAMAHAFADRATYGGDPDFAEVPVDALLDPNLPATLWEGTPATGPVPRLEAGLAGRRGDSKALFADDGGTSHLSVIDGSGRAVALTTTINLDFGSLQADPATGLVMNDEMDDFTARPGVPNAFGLVQGANNAPAPGKRPLSSMSPTLVTDAEGRVVLAAGAAGGPRIITATLQTILGVVDRGWPVQEALAAPRLHHQWLPEPTWVEPGLPDPTREALTAEGFELRDTSHLATAHATAFDPATGEFSAAADPRAGGSGAVVAPAETP